MDRECSEAVLGKSWLMSALVFAYTGKNSASNEKLRVNACVW